jgi:hypothetical protein
VVDNLAFKKVSQTKIDDFKIPSLLDTIVPVVEPAKIVPIKAEIFTPDVGSINLTNSARRVNTGDYLGRTAVEI